MSRVKAGDSFWHALHIRDAMTGERIFGDIVEADDDEGWYKESVPDFHAEGSFTERRIERKIVICESTNRGWRKFEPKFFGKLY